MAPIMAISAIIDVTTAGFVAPEDIIVFHILAFGPKPDVSGERGIPDSPDADEVRAARLWSVPGIADTSWDSWVRMLVPAAWADDAPCATNPAGLVVCCGALNGVTFEAAAELAA
ncbi:MAG: hypothetical protein ACREFY_08365 [Acetobacteraceae bacterium]